MAEERQRKSVSTLLNKEPVGAMAAFHITLISVSILSGSVFSFLWVKVFQQKRERLKEKATLT